jgi:hypothetical protein
MYIKQKEFLFVFFNCSEANKFHEQKPLKTENATHKQTKSTAKLP